MSTWDLLTERAPAPDTPRGLPGQDGPTERLPADLQTGVLFLPDEALDALNCANLECSGIPRRCAPPPTP